MTVSVADPAQKRKLILGVGVWVGGVAICLALIPFVNGSGLSTAAKATMNTILLIVCPKLFLLAAIAVMGKPGFAYLKSLVGGYFKRYAPPAEVSPARYKTGLVMLVTMIVLGSMGPYIAHDAFQFREEHPRILALTGDLLILVSLFVLGGDFWDKLRALFDRDAKAVFPGR